MIWLPCLIFLLFVLCLLDVFDFLQVLGLLPALGLVEKSSVLLTGKIHPDCGAQLTIPHALSTLSKKG